jgi:DNA topoisomerase-6 subunit A
MREELGLFAEPKGAMVGPMVIEDNGDTIDLARMGSGGWAIPSIVEANIIRFIRGKAKFVLLIEKGAVWRRFSEDRFWEKNKCMIIHGGGQPPRGVRRLIWRMHHELKLPVYVLVDNDPWGYYIYSVLKQGSINLAFESQRMAIPGARFIGMSAYDAARFSIPSTVSIKLNDQDVRRAKEVMNYPWFQKPAWQKEIKHMLKLGVKLELEAMSSKDFSFITEQYLPKKLKDKQWLD